jgi:hypothetical protein
MTAVAEPLRLSNSKTNTWRRCPKQYQFHYEMKLRKKQTGLPLKRGDWLHQLLMVHYDGYDWRERHKHLTDEFEKLFEEEKAEYGDLPKECERIMLSYLMFYKVEDKHYKVIDSEVDELIELPNGDFFNFIIDLIVEEPDGGIWLWDHKSVTNFMPEDFMLLDAQLARYFWAAKKMGFKPLRGVMFNEIITKPPTPPNLLKNGKLTTKKSMWCDARTYLATVREHGLDPKDYRDTILRLKSTHDRFFRRTRLPRDAPMMKQLMRELFMTSREIKEATARQEFPRTARKECRFDCDYLEPCIIQLQGGDISDVLDMRYETSKRDEEEHIQQWPTK